MAEKSKAAGAFEEAYRELAEKILRDFVRWANEQGVYPMPGGCGCPLCDHSEEEE